MDISEAIQKVAQVVADGLYKYAAALAAVGLVSMAIIQTVKDMLPTRRWFQDWRVCAWIRNQAAKAPPIQGGPPIPQVAEDDLVTLATSGDRAALFDLSIEQVSGLMNAASQIVLDFPPDHRDLLLCLAAQARAGDLELLLTQGPSAAVPRATLGDQERVRFVDARNRVTHQVQRSLDGLQISVGFRWKWIIQMLSIAVSALLVWIGLAAFAGERLGSNFHYFLLYLLAGLLGGFLAPVARDLVAALQQLRK